jgi:cytochrome P450
LTETMADLALHAPHQVPLAQIDVSDPRLYQQDVWAPLFARLRREDPVHYCAQSRFGPYWSVTKYNDIKTVDNNAEVFSSAGTIFIGDPPPDFVIELFIAMDGKPHVDQRQAVQPAVAPRNLQALEGIIRMRAANILDSLPLHTPFNWVERVSMELTIQMLTTLFNFPFDQRHKLAYWSDLSTAGDQTGMDDFSKEEIQTGLIDCMMTFKALFEERQKNPVSGTLDFVTMLAHDSNTRDMASRPMELMGNLMLLIAGGNDTTRNAMTGGVLALNQFPGEYEKLRNNPALIPAMVSEMVRWQTPVIHMRRTATRDTVLGGKQIHKGDKVVMWYLSGNRDEDMIEAADDFIIERRNTRNHVAFGFGPHRCMGNRMAEMQLRVLWEEIMKRFHHVEQVGPAVRIKSNFLRGIADLPVVLHPLPGRSA